MKRMWTMLDEQKTRQMGASKGEMVTVRRLTTNANNGLRAEDPEGIADRSCQTFGLEGWTGYLTSVRGLAPATVARYRFLVEQLVGTIADPCQLDRPLIEAHLQRLYLCGRGATVRRVALVAVRSYCEWLAAHGVLATNPAARLRGPRGYRKEKPHLTVGEVEKLIWGEREALPRDLLELRNRVLLAVTYVAGLRASEPGRLRVNGLLWDEARQAFSVLVEDGKAAGGDVRLHLNRRVSRLLGAFLPLRERAHSGSPWVFPPVRGDRPLSRAAVEKLFERRLGQSGIEAKGRRLTPHALRHSIATHLLEAGWDPKTVQAHLRHASLETTGEYLHTSTRKITRAFDRRDPLGARRQRSQVRGALGELLRELGGDGAPAAD